MCSGSGNSALADAKGNEQRVVYRKDYKPPKYLMQDIYLNFRLGFEETLVENTMLICAREANAGDLILHGEAIKLLSIEIAGKPLKEGDYKIGSDKHNPEDLLIKKEALPTQKPMKPFELKITNKCFPKANTELSG